MQNQGVAAARDMGASGINTVAEAKMYFQGMPQVDYSSPEAMQQSIREFRNTPTITTNNITLMLVNLSGSNLNLHRYHSQQPAVTFLHYGVING